MTDVETQPAGDPETTPAPSRPGRRWLRLIHASAWIALVGYGVLLLQRAQMRHQLSAGEPGMQLADLMRIREWALDLATMTVKTGLCFGLLGFLVAVALAGDDRPRRWAARLGRAFLWLLPGVGLTVLLALTETGRLPGLMSATLSLGAYLIGIWIGRTAWRGPWALVRLLPTFALLALLPVTAAAALAFLMVETQPFAFQPARVTPAEKRRLTELLKEPPILDDGSRLLRLSEDDANAMLTMAIAQVLPEAKGRVRLQENLVLADFSIPVSTADPPSRYVNAHVEWHVAIEGGELDIRWQSCRVGRTAIPSFVLGAGVRQAQAIAVQDADLNRLLDAIGSLRVRPGSVEAVLVSRGVVSDIVPSLMARLGRDSKVTARTRGYYQHLVRQSQEMPKDERFERLIAAAFQLAKERSSQSDPALENRAAVLALAILLGHHRVENLVGPVTDPESRLAARRYLRNVTLRGRNDWCRHYFVSAALALVSNEKLTDQAGLFKEESDSAEGGSGFSFSDLLADRAGTTFALAATRDRQAALKMQDRLAGGFDLALIFPEAADLPEGIPDAELQSDYGGVGGERYQAMIAEIERRLATCAGLTGP